MRAVMVAAAFPHGRQLFNVLVIAAVGSNAGLGVDEAAGMMETTTVWINFLVGGIETAFAFNGWQADMLKKKNNMINSLRIKTETLPCFLVSTVSLFPPYLQKLPTALIPSTDQIQLTYLKGC